MGRPGLARGTVGWITRSSDNQINDHRIICDGAIAQLGERYNGIVEVSGSIPLSSTNRFKKTRRQAGFCISDILHV